MKIVIACDSFKDALDAPGVCRALAKGIRKVKADAEVILLPLSDGGEGTAEIVTNHSGGQFVQIATFDPIGRPIVANYGVSNDGKTAYLDMAQASGLQLLKPVERNPLKTSTYGTGIIIKQAIEQGCTHIYLGIGGSATNDAGLGMARALGYQFLDGQGCELSGTGGDLLYVCQIVDSDFWVRRKVHITVLCDVDNPLYGPDGAAYVYAAQKGANQQTIELLDKGLRNLSDVCGRFNKKVPYDHPGAGAAGGLGFGALFFLGATLQSGIETVLDLCGLDEYLLDADLIITGEGKIDRQTLHGKAIQGIAKRASRRDVPIIAFCGLLNVSQEEIRKIGLHGAYAIKPEGATLEESIRDTEKNLETKAAEVLMTF